MNQGVATADSSPNENKNISNAASNQDRKEDEEDVQSLAKRAINITQILHCDNCFPSEKDERMANIIKEQVDDWFHQNHPDYCASCVE